MRIDKKLILKAWFWTFCQNISTPSKQNWGERSLVKVSVDKDSQGLFVMLLFSNYLQNYFLNAFIVNLALTC